MKIGSIIKHPEFGVGEITFIREGFPSARVLFARGEHKVLLEDLQPYDLALEGEPIDRFQGETRWLSNFEESEVMWNAISFKTVEHAYQAAKTSIPAEIEKVQSCATPGKAKRAGRKVTLRPDWEKVKIGIMAVLNLQKYSRHPELREKLLATGHRPLIEGNEWSDRFWGKCGAKLPDGSRGKLTGQNWLGRILMIIRENLRP